MRPNPRSTGPATALASAGQLARTLDVMPSGDYILHAETGHLNLSPYGFSRMAKHFLKCRQDFASPDGFSAVPYFLLCRAIELHLKALHLQTLRQKEVKELYWHDLERLYLGLPASLQDLAADELALLRKANAIYKEKGFEYFAVMDAATGYTRFPDLTALDVLAVRVLSHDV